jgi:hypothetical protein
MIAAYTFRVDPRPAWSIDYSTKQGDKNHDALVDSYWLWSGYLLYRDELVQVELVSTPTIANDCTWRWRIQLVAHEGTA